MDIYDGINAHMVGSNTCKLNETHTPTHTYTHTYTHANTHKHICIHTHTHTHTHTPNVEPAVVYIGREVQLELQ
jgi:hypothetical protein